MPEAAVPSALRPVRERRAVRVFWRYLVALGMGAAGIQVAPAAAQPREVAIETANGASGAQFYEPGRWGVVRTVVVNRSDADATPLIAVAPANADVLQFCSRVWLPPHSRREVFTPLMLEATEVSKGKVDLQTRLILGKGPDERSSPPESASVLVRDDRYDTGIFAEPDADTPRDLVAALRAAAGLKPTTTTLAAADCPAIPDGYEALDTIFIARRDPGLEPRRLAALRGWLERGGRLWIMLDRVDPRWPARLLGDEWTVSVLDTVEATRFSIDGAGSSTPQALDFGVPLLRVCAPGFEVTHRIGGTPAALRKRIGRGVLVVSTLDARGWLDPKQAATPALKDFQAFVAPTSPAMPSIRVTTSAFDALIRGEIGYQIADRAWVLAVLIGSTAVILGAGVPLARRGRLEIAALVAVACAGVGGTALALTSLARQNQTPTTVATAQLVGFDGRSSSGDCVARISVYTAPKDAASPISPALQAGGVVLPDRTGQGSLTRVVWTDLDHVAVEDVQPRPGSVHNLTARGQVALDSAPTATIRFEDRSLSGTVRLGDMADLEASLIVTPTGCISASLHGDGRFSAGSEDVLAPGEFATSALLTKEQMARQAVFAGLIGKGLAVSRPTLLVWTRPMPMGLALPASVRTSGAAIAALPLMIEKPAPGTTLGIPAPFMRVAPLKKQSVAGRTVSRIYNPDTHQCLPEIHQAMLVLMQFTPPEEIGPLDVHAGSLLLELRAPGRDYQIVTVDGDRLRVLREGVNPAGRETLDLTGDRRPITQPDGSIIIGVGIKAAADELKSEGWSLQRLELSVTGQVK